MKGVRGGDEGFNRLVPRKVQKVVLEAVDAPEASASASH